MNDEDFMREALALATVAESRGEVPVGALVVRVWNLPPVLMAAIRLHHDLEVIEESRSQSEVNTLIAMGLVADYFMHRHEGLEHDVDWKSHGAAAMEWLQISGDELLAWEEELREIFDAA